MEGQNLVQVKLDEDSVAEITHAILSLGERENVEKPVLNLQRIFARIADMMDRNDKYPEYSAVFFYKDPSQTDLDEFKVCRTKDGSDFRVFLPVENFSLLQHVSQPMLEAVISQYMEQQQHMVHTFFHEGRTCFFNLKWRNSLTPCISFDTWSASFGQCLFSYLHHDSKDCGGTFQKVCKCRNHVCDSHLYLVQTHLKCFACEKNYNIEGLQVKKIKINQ